jgi:hypothetical protein
VLSGQNFAPAGLRHDFFTVYQEKRAYQAGMADRYPKENIVAWRTYPVVFI